MQHVQQYVHALHFRYLRQNTPGFHAMIEAGGLTVANLQGLCALAGLPKTGRKGELQARVLAYAGTAVVPEPDAAGPPCSPRSPCSPGSPCSPAASPCPRDYEALGLFLHDEAAFAAAVAAAVRADADTGTGSGPFGALPSGAPADAGRTGGGQGLALLLGVAAAAQVAVPGATRAAAALGFGPLARTTLWARLADFKRVWSKHKDSMKDQYLMSRDPAVGVARIVHPHAWYQLEEFLDDDPAFMAAFHAPAALDNDALERLCAAAGVPEAAGSDAARGSEAARGLELRSRLLAYRAAYRETARDGESARAAKRARA